MRTHFFMSHVASWLRSNYVWRKIYSSRITLRIEDVKFEAHAGREFGAKLGESVKEIEDGGFELALGAVKSRVDDFLAQKLPEALNQVQVGRIRGQEDLHEALIGQPGVEGLVFVVAGIVADDVYRAFGVGG